MTTLRALAEGLGVPVTALTAEPRPAPHTERLPVPLSPLIGREAELTELGDDVRAERLVTVVGPGGVGKTRLTLQLARDIEEKYAGGVHWVELAPATDAAGVASAVLTAVDAPESSSQPAIDQVRAALARTSEPTLLVVDNCEHVLAAAADLVESVLSTLSHVAVLATSRDPLHVAGELVWRLDPLAVPAEDDDLPEIASGAMAMFADRARRADRRFVLDEAVAVDVAAVCRRLDGLPFAIELAASRVASLSVAAIRVQLDTRLDDVGRAARSTPDRHRTVAGCVRWSYDLLATDERALLRALSVFVGRFDLDAVVGVTGATGHDDVAPILDRLVDHSLVVTAGDATTLRYRLLETVRDFLRSEAEALGELALLRRAHADHFESWMHARAEAPDDATVTAIAAAYPDVRAALVRSIADASPRAARLAVALGTPWYLLSRYRDALELGDAALAIARAEGELEWAIVAAAIGFARLLGGDWTFVDETLPAALDVATRHGAELAEGWCRLTIGLRPPWDLAHFAAARAIGVAHGSGQLAGMAAGMEAVALGACAESDALLAGAEQLAERIDNGSLHGLLAIARCDQMIERAQLVAATDLAERYAGDERVTIPVRLLLVSRLVAVALQRLDRDLADRAMQLGARLARVWNPAGFPGLNMTAKRLVLLAGDRPVIEPIDELGTHLGIQPATLRMICRTAIDVGERLDPDEVARRAVIATQGDLVDASIMSVHAAHAVVDGDLATGRALWERVLTLASAGGYELLVVDALEALAVIEQRAGNGAAAAARLADAGARRAATDNRFRFDFEQAWVDEAAAAAR